MRRRASGLIRDTGRGHEAAILRAALEAFAAKGFNGTSMREVAHSAGTSLSNLYNYFPSKGHLLAELLQRAGDEQLSRVRDAAAGGSATERLDAVVRAHIGFSTEHQLAALVALSEVRYLVGEQRTRVVRARDAVLATVARIVADGAASGEFGTPHPHDAARAIVAMCSSVATWYRPRGRLSRKALAEQHARYALALLEADALG
ncbi:MULTISPECIES: TetR/AcrR family transcriptional regulator [Saccharopolyspora]|uniref:TetR/AcrR family transcriptional regulator n=1 Tax=Saccharopolyspora cebuensis TaxID=418759 RepID=A0ABV4CHT7_9PSEU